MLLYILFGLGLTAVLATLIPLIKHEAWWIRIFDFPRIQITLLNAVILIAWLFVFHFNSYLEVILTIALMACLIYQVYNIFPYTRLAKCQVLKSTKTNNEVNHISILVTNVLMSNREAEKCREVIRKVNPDVILAVETDKWWQKELKEFELSHPFFSHAPMANTYGLLFYSRLKILQCEIKYLLSHNIPSLHCTLELKSGLAFKFYGVHPPPPAPGESKSSVHRDAELIIIGKEAKNMIMPVIIAGDLNDVAWSHTTRLFQRVSGLLDPRRGRGMFSTFNAKYPFFRWPLDHIFHSNHFKLVEIKRLPFVGSDHFPIFLKLSFEPESVYQQPEQDLSDDDITEAKEKIIKGKEK